MNSASRLLAIVNHFNSAQKHETMKQLWCRFLDLPMSGSDEEALIATQGVLAEIRTTEAKLKILGAPETLFNEVASILRNSFSPTQLSSQWIHHREQVKVRAVPLALEWASWALAQFEEDDMPEESLRALGESLAAQETLLMDTNMSPALREMLERQVSELRIALSLYKVRGKQPLTDAVIKQYGEMQHAPDEILEEINSGPETVKSVAKKAGDLINEAGKLADNGSKFFKFAKEAHEAAGIGLSYVQQLLSP